MTAGRGAIKAESPGQLGPVYYSRASLGKQLLYSTYLGGPANEQASDLVLDAAGNVYVGGATYSTAFPGVAEVPGRGWNRVRFEIIGIVCRLVPASPGQWINDRRQPRVGHTGKRHSHREQRPLPISRRLQAAYRRCSPTDTTAGLSPFYVRIAASDGAVKYSTYLYENAGGSRWAATLPAGDVVTISRLHTSFERAPNIIRRYVFSAAPANRLDCVLNAASYRSEE